MAINYKSMDSSISSFRSAFPFDHCVIDDFLQSDTAVSAECEFPSYDDKRWMVYSNAIENKKTMNDWNAFPPVTYRIFQELLSHEFVTYLSQKLDLRLFQDPGLHGGGWHIHATGGNLNPHLDYSIHPKAGLQRKLNIIIYLSSELREEHGGHLGLWSRGPSGQRPGALEKAVQPRFNRAVLFDTTQESWHGMCRPLTQPVGIFRKSLAVYYLTDPPVGVDRRERALFAPRDDQFGDKQVEDLIRRRASATEFATAYRTDGSQNQ